MICPCHECTHRTAMPNCHGTCEAYKEYQEYRTKIRIARQLQRVGDDARIRQSEKRKAEYYRTHKTQRK